MKWPFEIIHIFERQASKLGEVEEAIVTASNEPDEVSKTIMGLGTDISINWHGLKLIYR